MSDLLDPNPFAKPIMAPHGDLDSGRLYSSIGYALSAWEITEMSFFTLFGKFVKPNGSTYALSRAYGTIVSQRSRKEMIAAAAEVYFSVLVREQDVRELQSETSKLLGLYMAAGTRRNEIAHGIVTGDPQTKTEGRKLRIVGTHWYLRPSFTATKKQLLHLQGPKFQLSSDEILFYAERFEALGGAISNLIKKLQVAFSALPEKARERLA